MRRLLLCTLGIGLLVVGLGGRAFAYPQFQFSSGTTRCSQCHYSPSGGGLLTSWGRDESGDTISLGGDGAFLHGLVDLPSAVALGADVRVAGLVNDTGGYQSPEDAVFPMEADAYARFKFGDQFSLYLQGGARGDTRPPDMSPGGPFKSLGNALISYEHYLMWRPSPTGPYARVGRFYAPYGLRFAEHIFWVERYTGFDLYNQTYNVSGGYVAEDWEAHLTLFAPPPTNFPDALQSIGPRQSGVAAYAEKRWNEMSLLGLQARVGVGDEATWYQGGAVGKLWLEQAKLLVMGEADLNRQMMESGSVAQNQFVSYLGLTFFPIRGLMGGVAYERFQRDLAVAGTGQNAADVEVNFFPWAHFELMAFGRYQFFGPGANDGTSGSMFMFQIHYYL